MKKLRLYLDTTIWNFPFVDDSPEHRAETLEFFQKTRLGLFDLFYSDAVEREVIAAPPLRRRQVENLLEQFAPKRLAFRTEIDELANEYLRRSVLPKRSHFDALHVAYATVYKMDALVSWNFRHLANVNRRKRVMSLNREKGYNFPIELVTPLEVLGDERD
jgi:predicted nucleic acid-binding protein